MFKRYKIALPALLLLAVSLALRLINLDKGISGDEGALLLYAQGSPLQILERLKDIAIFPPLSAFGLHLWMFFGNGEVWARMYFVFFGAGSCYLVYLIGREYIDERFGHIALLIASISPFLIWTSQYVRSYSDATFWMLASSLFFLRMVKEEERLSNYLFFAGSCAAGIYTAYFNILIVMSQFIFWLIFFFRDAKRLFRGALAFMLTGFLFAPWFLTALNQYHNATAIKEFWNLKGFRYGGLYLGRYIRQILALCGMDPDFLSAGGSLVYMDKKLLFAASFAIFIAALWLIYLSIRALYRMHKGNHKLVWLFVILAFLPVVFANLAEALYNFRPTSKLFSYGCAVFIFPAASAVYSLRGRKMFYPLLSVIIFIYLLRLPVVYQPETDTKKAYNFLSGAVKENETILMVRNTNYYLSCEILPAIVLKDYLERDAATGNYEALSPSTKAVLKDMKDKYESIWFYRAYGNDEIFGANILVTDWLEENGYYLSRLERFKQIDILNFKKAGNKI